MSRDSAVLDRRVAVLMAGLCLVAVVLDAVWFARAPTPLASPSLLLVLVVAVGLLGGARAGATAGLAAGLLADLTPPSALVVGVGAAGLAAAGVVGGLLGRRHEGPHRPRRWVRTLVDAATTGVAALVGMCVVAAGRAAARALVETPSVGRPGADASGADASGAGAFAADTPVDVVAVLQGIGAGAAYAAIVALIVLPVVRAAARRLSQR